MPSLDAFACQADQKITFQFKKSFLKGTPGIFVTFFELKKSAWAFKLVMSCQNQKLKTVGMFYSPNQNLAS